MNESKIVTVRFSNEEYENLKRDAGDLDMNVSEYVRAKVTDTGKICTLMFKRKVSKELFAICSAVNVVSNIMTETHPTTCDTLEKGVVSLWNTILK